MNIPLTFPELNKNQPEPLTVESIEKAESVYLAINKLVETILANPNRTAIEMTERMTGLNLAGLIDGDKPEKGKAFGRAVKPERPRREKGLYGLPDYYSFRELSQTTGHTQSTIRDLLASNGIIHCVEHGSSKTKRWLLTEKGWQVGVMYSPSTNETFTPEQSERILATSSQPVFTPEVAKYL